MAQIVCPKCKKKFNANNKKSLVTRGVAAAAGSGTGAWIGSGFGLAGGPIGAISAAVPGAIFGGVTGWLAGDQFRRCPKCGKVFKT